MTNPKDPVFVVLTISGRVWKKPTDTGYFGLLRDVYVELQSAGSDWDCPWKLLMNGEIVVPEKLKDIAYDFCTTEDHERFAVAARVRAAQWPSWLPKPEKTQ